MIIIREEASEQYFTYRYETNGNKKTEVYSNRRIWNSSDCQEQNYINASGNLEIRNLHCTERSPVKLKEGDVSDVSEREYGQMT